MKEPSMDAIRREVIGQISRRDSMSDEELLREIDRAVLRRGREHHDSLERMGDLRRDTFDAIRRFGILEKYLRDDRVTEIMITGADRIYVERDGIVCRTGDSFSGEEEVRCLVEMIAAPANRIVNESRPIADSRLPDGSRAHIVLPPVSLDGPVITIRKFQKGGMTMEKLVGFREFPPELVPLLRCLVRGRYSILISGSTNSGKSSLLNALGEFIGKRERIITIEDSSELQLFHIDNLVRLETREANAEGENAITMKDLIRASLRMRPDRIIVGEVRGEEALQMLHAYATGHSGSISSIHANSCRDSLRRLETMVLMGIDMPLRAVQGLIASSIDILIHLGRRPDGERRLMELTELVGIRGAEYRLNPLFKLEQAAGEPEMETLHLAGRLSETQKMISEGVMSDYENALEAFRRMENTLRGAVGR